MRRDLRQFNQDIVGFVKSMVAYDQYFDQSLSWFLLLVKNLRELNNFLSLKFVLTALNEECHPGVYRLILSQLQSIPELLTSTDIIPAGSIRQQLVVPTAVPIRQERFVNPQLKTVVEDCLSSIGLKPTKPSAFSAAKWEAAGCFSGNVKADQLVSPAKKDGALSYRVLYADQLSDTVLEQQTNYLKIMCASAPPVIYDLDFVLHILNQEFMCHMRPGSAPGRKIELADYLRVQAQCVCLVQNLNKFTFNFDDYNDEVLEKLLKTLPRLGDAELEAAVKRIEKGE